MTSKIISLGADESAAIINALFNGAFEAASSLINGKSLSKIKREAEIKIIEAKLNEGIRLLEARYRARHAIELVREIKNELMLLAEETSEFTGSKREIAEWTLGMLKQSLEKLVQEYISGDCW